MLLKYFYDEALAHASYFVGCQRSEEAIVIDPGRDIDQYIDVAKRHGMRIVGVAETHIHADYVSGARELADRLGAKLYVSDEGPKEWKYLYLQEYDHRLLRDGDVFRVGNVKFEVMHTPGHTPESLSFVLTDEGGGADEPMGIFTGDFVFVGSIGRPDLLEEAAGIAGTAEPGARDLFRSAQRFKELPEFLQVWPAHGAGSACGKGLGAVPSSTVGYEKRFNPALQIEDEETFVRYILADQPEAPKYFAIMKRVNKEGPELINRLPTAQPVDPQSLVERVGQATILDLSSPDQFAQGHVPGTWNIPLGMLATWAGWLVDYSRPVYLIGDSRDFDEAVRVLRKIGVDQVMGVCDVSEVKNAKLATQSYRTVTPTEIADEVISGAVQLIDVRSQSEWREGSVPGAQHLFLGRLPESMAQLDQDKPVAALCRGGARGAIAASILQAAGFDAMNILGGYEAWRKAGLPKMQTVANDASHADSQKEKRTEAKMTG